MPIPQNLIFIYTGNGKGKTSASLGLAWRSLRDNKKVILVQFIKSEKESGEVSLKKVLPKLQVKCFGKGFVIRSRGREAGSENTNSAGRGIKYALQAIKSGKFNVLILDEILVAYNLKLIKLNDIIKLIKEFRKERHGDKMLRHGEVRVLVLTGRGCPKSLYKYADLVTEMKEIKHPFSRGIQAIKGIDY